MNRYDGIYYAMLSFPGRFAGAAAEEEECTHATRPRSTMKCHGTMEYDTMLLCGAATFAHSRSCMMRCVTFRAENIPSTKGHSVRDRAGSWGAVFR